jgi:hypothetical protein
LYCLNSLCTGPACDDNVQNGAETDVDCGGGTCSPCAIDLECLVHTDCSTNNCTQSICVVTPETCQDNIKNQDESDTDCGGSCTKCALNKSCGSSDDCSSGFCSQNICSTPPSPVPVPTSQPVAVPSAVPTYSPVHETPVTPPVSAPITPPVSAPTDENPPISDNVPSLEPVSVPVTTNAPVFAGNAPQATVSGSSSERAQNVLYFLLISLALYFYCAM